MKWLGILLFLPLLASAEVVTWDLRYEHDGATFNGLVAWDNASSKKRPGILVVHEWWGHNSYARSRAKQLAELGYVAVALDMYGEGKTADHPKDAGAFSKSVMSNMELMRGRFEAAQKLLLEHPLVDTKATAAIGYCFGGAVVLHMARLGSDLRGVVSFHGSLGTQHPAKSGKVGPKILVCHGAADTFISDEQIAAFKKEMRDAKADMSFKAYPDALHSFTNPDATATGERLGIPIAYNEAADRQSWSDMKAFFASIFSK
ncbi:MAG: dienelactone hydrolase [Rhodothermales bacterium]|jgi:dienelactone hydrolase